MRDPSWIRHSTLTKHQAGTTVQDWWPMWPAKFQWRPSQAWKNALQSPCGYQVLGPTAWIIQSTFGLWCTGGDKLQHLICSFSIRAPFFTFTLKAVVSAVTLSPYYPPFLLILQGTFPLLPPRPPTTNYLSSRSIHLSPSWSIMEVQLLADGDWDEQKKEPDKSQGVCADRVKATYKIE